MKSKKNNDMSVLEAWVLLLFLAFSIWGIGQFIGHNMMSWIGGFAITLFIYKCYRVFKSKDFKKAWNKYDLF